MRLFLVFALALASSSPRTAVADVWPSFRGEFARGVADGHPLPERWDPASGANVRWRAEVPGAAHSSPIVWGDRAYVVTAVTDGEPELVLGDAGGISLAGDRASTFSWRLYAFDTASGEVVWRREAYAGLPRAGRHVKSSQANATPATDGGTVVAIFGSQGMVAYGTDGEERWRVDLGVLDPGLFGDSSSHWGHASSPVIHDGRVFVQVDRHSGSFVAAYDLATGEALWSVERDEKPVWATPTVHQTADRAQLIVVGGDFDRGLDPATGRELWRFARDLEVKTPTPFVAGDHIVLAGGYRGKELFAVEVTAEGLVEEAGLAWKSSPGGPYTSTPVVYRERLFYVRDTGILHVLDPATGESLHRERLDGTYSASPVAGDGKVYLAGEDGVVRILSAEAPFAELAAVDMGAPCMATPAIADGTIYLRCGIELLAVADVGSRASNPER
jgi:outer membrane protein assembly factor BamB